VKIKNFKRRIVAIILIIGLALPMPAKADMFGGDIVMLTQILANAIQQLVQLKQILSTGSDSLNLMKDINRGIKDGLSVIQVLNPKFNPGLYGSMEQADQVLAVISDLYGKIPQTSESKLQAAQDRSVSESIAMNGTLFRYADDVDQESKRIIEHAKNVNPQGAAKLTAQSIAVLIGVTTQVLRTNSMMLKMMGENMALSNRKEKLQSSQFKTQYEGISNALGTLPKETNLKPLGSP
jgi:hypothetical protein